MLFCARACVYFSFTCTTAGVHPNHVKFFKKQLRLQAIRQRREEREQQQAEESHVLGEGDFEDQDEEDEEDEDEEGLEVENNCTV
jgi:hypothetical protein